MIHLDRPNLRGGLKVTEEMENAVLRVLALGRDSFSERHLVA